ncbi:MAG: hypothetical protein C0410_13390 [Anaerolinea sp.]|nr:hypothetical protein [Anaerolinea sp.]
MNKHLKNILFVGIVMLLLAACAAPTAQPTPLPTASAAATATLEPMITSTPIVIVVTATPMPATATMEETTATVEQATNTAVPKITFTPSIPGAYNGDGTPIKSESSIIITNIKEAGSGQAQIFWTASGTFSNGFKIYYSSYIKNPVFGGEKSEYAISDGLTRSAYITGTPGTTYNYRLCSFTGSNCAFYSNTFTYTFLAATSTP